MVKFHIFILILFCLGCTSNQSENEATEKLAFEEPQNVVDILVLKNKTFEKELVSNGKLKAVRKSELKFNVGEQLRQLNVKNGQQVAKGAVIAVLKQFEYQQKLNEVRTALRKTRLEFQDILIGQGYDLDMDTAKIPGNIYETAGLRSGYLSAVRQEETAEYEYQSTVMKAPFTGKIANLKYKVFEQVSPGEIFCILIDDSEFEVEFFLVESEIRDIQVGDVVKIIPFSLEDEFEGKVSEINPVVDENGLVTVRARVRNPGQLMEGMNVKVLSQKAVPNQLIVPKSAVVLRQNQEVLFKYVAGHAFWTYVKTGLENSTSYTVQAHPEKGGSLTAGDTVIISGNLNLAHESEVVTETRNPKPETRNQKPETRNQKPETQNPKPETRNPKPKTQKKMATIKKFEDLDVWKLGRDLSLKVYQLLENEKFRKDFSLADQIKRSSGSVMDNIAEGFERDGSREFKQFLSIAKASAGETKSQLYRALDQNYISPENFEELYNMINNIGGKIKNLMDYLRSSEYKGTKYKS